MSLVGYIDKTGIHTPTYPEVLAELQKSYRAIFGSDVYLEADSQEGQMVAMFALAIYDANQLAVSVYNSFSPQTAQGAGLSRMVKINGIARISASSSTVDLTLTGQAGTVITGGVAEDVAGQKWDLPETVTIPTGGEVTITATARDAGAVQAAAGDVNVIATPTRGWQSVVNAQAATPGTDAETDAALRLRQGVSTALPSLTVLEGIVGALANLDGVTRVQGYENDADEADGNDIPAHCLAMVVEGGEVTGIAEAIAAKKTPGAGTYGDVSATVEDAYGLLSTIQFFRPGEVAIDAEIVITPRSGYVSTTGTSIQEGLAEYFNELEIGEDVLLSKLYTPINAAEPLGGKRSFDVAALTIARHGDGLAAANIVLGFTEMAVGDVANITVTVQE